MGKKAALFDTEEFNIKGELKAQEVHEAQEIHEINKVHEVHEVQEVQEIQKEIGTTQGKKGFKLKRINMAFSDINHAYVTQESRRRGISSTAFVNLIIDEYRNKR